MTSEKSNMKALVLTTATRTMAVEEVPLPTPGAGKILVRAHAIALNAIDTIYPSFTTTSAPAL
jgi:NADPH:quinone reductase-like Zn-dependent oxidoreductase